MNGFDKTNQHGRQTTETAEIHRPLSSSLSSLNGPPSDAGVDHEEENENTDHNMNVVVHSADDELITKNDPQPEEPEPEPVSNNDTNFPTPPASVVSDDMGISIATTEQDSITTDTVSLAHSDPTPDPTPAPSIVSANQPDVSVLFGTSPGPPTHSSSPSPSPTPPPPPPPPPPPLPTSFSSEILPAPKPSSSSIGGGGKQNQEKLEEMKRQDARHAELMAAVARRKVLLDNTDAEEVAKSIESKIHRNCKMQTVFHAHDASSVPHAGLLAPSGKPHMKPENTDTPVVENANMSVQNASSAAPNVLLAPSGKPDTKPDMPDNTDSPDVETVGTSVQHASSVAPAGFPAPSDKPETKQDTPKYPDSPIIEAGERLLSCCYRVNCFLDT